MNDKQDYSTRFTVRESLLMSLLGKLLKEYKALLEYTRRTKPLKIVEIINLSSTPGETKFTIQIAHKNCIAHLSAGELMSAAYNLDDFNEFHAEMIRQAARGTILEFLGLSEKKQLYQIISKRFNSKIQQTIFTIETKENICFTRTAEELSRDRNILTNIDAQDIYDIGFTQGAETIVKEKSALLIAKEHKQN